MEYAFFYRNKTESQMDSRMKKKKTNNGNHLISWHLVLRFYIYIIEIINELAWKFQESLQMDNFCHLPTDFQWKKMNSRMKYSAFFEPSPSTNKNREEEEETLHNTWNTDI